MSRALRIVGLVVALLWAQWAAAVHGGEHLAEVAHEHEEVCLQCLALGGGTTLKAGRILSGIANMNGQHAHAWDFADAPLAYKAMLGGQ